MYCFIIETLNKISQYILEGKISCVQTCPLISNEVSDFKLNFSVVPGVLVGAFVGSQGEGYYAKDM